jgi:DNA-binding beta-propeller fold protein YncE
LSIDSHGNIYVADAGNNKIRKITPDGTVSTLAGNGKRGTENGPLKSASFWRPFDVTVGLGNVLYVADYQNNTVRKISL